MKNKVGGITHSDVKAQYNSYSNQHCDTVQKTEPSIGGTEYRMQ